jgi:hypothetical protein
MAVTDAGLLLSVLKEREWLVKHPQFEERPASMPEFLGPNYLNIEAFVRPAVRQVCIDIFGEESNFERIATVARGIFTGAIGIGKTTFASIALTYMAHWVLCLKDPQGFYDLMPGTRIAFMQMSTSATQAKEVVFGDIKARIDNSPWFQARYPRDTKFTNQIRFAKEIWIIPGDSAETTFEGYNILGGVLDEIDSHKVTKVKDYADQGYTTIHGRITSRFQDRGLILLVGQMKKATGFAAKMYRDMRADPKAYTCRMKIWESLGWDRWTKDGVRDSFWYDTSRYAFTTKSHAEFLGYPETIIEVPEVYRRDFMNSPMKALRDLCGMPPAVEAPFIHDSDKIAVSRIQWKARYGPIGPVETALPGQRDKIAEWFRASDGMKRVIHVDIAYSGEGDALGLAMGHVPNLVTVDDEDKPFISIDLLLRLKANPGQEIILGDVRKIIYDLRDVRRFKIAKVTTDGFESTDFRQQLNKRRIHTELLSVDKSMLPYSDLYDSLMEERLALPPYMTYIDMNGEEPIDIAFKELTELQETGVKIDHPPDGSKDLTDAIAGVVSTLMGNRTYQSRKRLGEGHGEMESPAPRMPGDAGRFRHPAVDPDYTPKAPVPTASFDGEPVAWNPPRRKYK